MATGKTKYTKFEKVKTRNEVNLTSENYQAAESVSDCGARPGISSTRLLKDWQQL